MTAVEPWSTRRAGRALLVGVVAAAHIAAFLIISMAAPKEKPPIVEPSPLTFAVLPFTPPEPQVRRSPRAVQEKRAHDKKKPALAAAPAPTTPSRAQNQAPAWTLPATGSHGAAAGELADPYAVREALRGSVGCDMENLKLRPDEQARCDDRTGRWAKKGRKIGPAEDDPRRAAELAAEEDYQRRRHDWTTTDCGIHNAHDELDMTGTLGQLPPHRGKSKDGEDEARANAC